jgi:hypothetical protein
LDLLVIKTVPEISTMLRWTCRLRDVLESRDFYVHDNENNRPKLALMREAEFVTSQDQDKMDWESFLQVFSGVKNDVTLYYGDDAHTFYGLVPVFQPDCSESHSIRSLSGQAVSSSPHAKIDVLWLTPTVFISTFQFYLYIAEEECLSFHSYKVRMQPRGMPSRTINFSAGELTPFETCTDFSWPDLEHPVIPLEFLRRMTASLPPGYFSTLSLTRYPQGFPVDYFQAFIACLPFVSESQPVGPSLQTRLEFLHMITNEELQVILSHGKLHGVQLSLGDGMYDDAPSIEVNDTLRTYPHLCSFAAPRTMVECDYAGESFATNESVEFLELLPIKATNDVPLKLFDEITSNSSIHELKISFEIYNYLTGLHQIPVKLRYLLKRVLRGRSSVKKLTICFCFGNIYNDFGKHYNRALKAFKAIELHKFSDVTGLHFLSFAFEYYKYSRPSSNSGDRKRTRKIKNPLRPRWWDRKLAPYLALNFYSEHMPPKLIAPVTPLAIRAVNLGIVYRNTTHHLPRDMNIANAGFIYRLVRKGSVVGGEKQHK